MSKIQELRQKLVKFQNLEEHRKGISRDIRSKSQLQNDFLALAEQVKVQIARNKEKSVLLDKEKELLKRREEKIEQQEEDLQNRFLLVSEKETQIQRREEEITRKETEILSLANNKLSEASLQAEKIQNDTLTAQEELKSIARLLEANKEAFNTESQSIVNELDAKKQELSDLNSELTTQAQELYRINQKIEQAELMYQHTFDKNSTFLYNLNQKEEEIKKAIKDMRVYTARLRALYKKHFNKEINLQDVTAI